MRFSSFENMLEYYAKHIPDAPAFLYEDYGVQSLNYASLLAAVRDQAADLAKCNECCIGIFTDGTKDCVIEIFAAAMAGYRIVLLDENASEEILKEQVSCTDVTTLYGDEELCAELSDVLILPECGRMRGTGERPEKSPSVAKAKESEKRADPHAPAQILFFTSGTTDRQKAVVLTEKNLMASAWNGSALLPLKPEDRLLCALPLNHVFGFVCGLLWGLSCGACVALGRGMRHYHEDCMLFRPTALSAVPLLWGFLLKHKALNPELKLVLIGAGDCPKELIEAAKPLGIRLCFGYGLTETSSGVALSTEGDPYAMTVCPDDTIEIAKDGEICIKAPTCMMLGYYQQEDATKEVLRSGTLFTGDLGFLDEEGKLHITGRKKEMLVLSDGTKVFLPEYEKECAAALETDELCICDRNGVLTLVLGSSTASGTEQDILKKLQPVTSLRPRGQQLQRIEFHEGPLPRTASGKIRRFEV